MFRSAVHRVSESRLLAFRGAPRESGRQWGAEQHAYSRMQLPSGWAQARTSYGPTFHHNVSAFAARRGNFYQPYAQRDHSYHTDFTAGQRGDHSYHTDLFQRGRRGVDRSYHTDLFSRGADGGANVDRSYHLPWHPMRVQAPNYGALLSPYRPYSPTNPAYGTPYRLGRGNPFLSSRPGYVVDQPYGYRYGGGYGGQGYGFSRGGYYGGYGNAPLIGASSFNTGFNAAPAYGSYNVPSYYAYNAGRSYVQAPYAQSYQTQYVSDAPVREPYVFRPFGQRNDPSDDIVSPLAPKQQVVHYYPYDESEEVPRSSMDPTVGPARAIVKEAPLPDSLIAARDAVFVAMRAANAAPPIRVDAPPNPPVAIANEPQITAKITSVVAALAAIEIALAESRRVDSSGARHVRLGLLMMQQRMFRMEIGLRRILLADTTARIGAINALRDGDPDAVALRALLPQLNIMLKQMNDLLEGSEKKINDVTAELEKMETLMAKK